MTMRLTLLFCALCAMRVASAQDEAATALADCQAHQQKLEDLESNMTAPAQAAGSGTGWQPQAFGGNEVERERALTDRICTYARALRQPAAAPKARPTQRPAPFRADEYRAPAPPPVQPAPQVVAPAAPPASQAITPPPAQRQVIRRPPPLPAPPSVGGTKARHPEEEARPPPPQ